MCDVIFSVIRCKEQGKYETEKGTKQVGIMVHIALTFLRHVSRINHIRHRCNNSRNRDKPDVYDLPGSEIYKGEQYGRYASGSTQRAVVRVVSVSGKRR